MANLWDVTDRDIDRFARAVLEAWLPPTGSDEPTEGCSATAPLVPGAGAHPERLLSQQAAAAGGCGRGAAVSAAVAAGRGACRLPHLIGAAPVCYGLPSSVGW